MCASARIPCFFFEFEFPGAGRPMMSGSTTPACAVRDGRRAVTQRRFGASFPSPPASSLARGHSTARAQSRRSRMLRGPSRTMATAASLRRPRPSASARRRAAAPGPVGGRVPSRVLARAGKRPTRRVVREGTPAPFPSSSSAIARPSAGAPPRTVRDRTAPRASRLLRVRARLRARAPRIRAWGFYRIRPKKISVPRTSPAPHPDPSSRPPRPPPAAPRGVHGRPRALPPRRLARASSSLARAAPSDALQLARGPSSCSSSSAPGDASGAGKLDALLAAIRARAPPRPTRRPTTTPSPAAGSPSTPRGSRARARGGERENAELRAKVVAEPTTAADFAVAELLEDAAELALAVARAEDLAGGGRGSPRAQRQARDRRRGGRRHGLPRRRFDQASAVTSRRCARRRRRRSQRSPSLRRAPPPTEIRSPRADPIARDRPRGGRGRGRGGLRDRRGGSGRVRGGGRGGGGAGAWRRSPRSPRRGATTCSTPRRRPRGGAEVQSLKRRSPRGSPARTRAWRACASSRR